MGNKSHDLQSCVEVAENNRKCCRHAGKLQDHSYLEYWLRHEMANSHWKKKKKFSDKILGTAL